MKKILNIAFAVILGVSGLFAQKTEGHITYSVSMSSDDPQMAQQTAMMEGSTFDLYFTDKVTRSEMKMGSLMTVATIVEPGNDQLLTLMSGMIGQKAIKTTLTEIDAMKDEEDTDMQDYDVFLVEGESKKIAGYNCKKAIVTDEDGNETIFWYTEDLAANPRGQSYLNSKINGVPLEFEINQKGFKMSFVATNVETSIPKAKQKELFSMEIPEGYTEMTLEQMQQMQGK